MRWGCQRNNQRSPKTLLFVFRCFDCRPAAFCAVWGGQPVLEVGVVCANIDQRLFLVKPYIGCFFLLGQPCSHASFQRLCYAIGIFFGCSLRLLTLEKWRFSNRSTPDNAQFVRRAPHHHTRRRAYTGRNRLARRCRIS